MNTNRKLTCRTIIVMQNIMIEGQKYSAVVMGGEPGTLATVLLQCCETSEQKMNFAYLCTGLELIHNDDISEVDYCGDHPFDGSTEINHENALETIAVFAAEWNSDDEGYDHEALAESLTAAVN